MKLPEAERKHLDELYRRLKEIIPRCLGYPPNAAFDYSDLYRFLEFPLNNLGDPFVPATYKVNSRAIEREVIRIFAEITHARPKEAWGYVTNGGTEGNLYGLYLARELMPRGIVYYSEDTHYSVAKSLRLLNMRHIMIKAAPSGRIDLEDLSETIRLHRDVPPIILANVGTTMKEAVDDIPGIRGILQNFAIPRSYIHADAALSGMTLPFIDGAPAWDFSAGVDSLSISGHKMIGSPIPCGVVLARKAHVDRIARSIEYIGTLDTTISGSRNGFTPLVLWHAMKTHGIDGFRRLVRECVERAAYAVSSLLEAGIKAWRHPHAITVVFPAPPGSVAEKWQLAREEGEVHLIALPHVTRERIDALVADIRRAKEKSA